MGDVLSHHLPPDGRTQRQLYYGSGHLQQINLDREVISEFTRDHLHREVLRSQGRLNTRQVYDPAGRVKRRETYSGMRGMVPDTLTDRQYDYNGRDELTKKRHSRRGETDYFYDTTGRITACRAEDKGYLESWQYDAAGNLLDRLAGERATAENSVVRFNWVYITVTTNTVGRWKSGAATGRRPTILFNLIKLLTQFLHLVVIRKQDQTTFRDLHGNARSGIKSRLGQLAAF